MALKPLITIDTWDAGIIEDETLQVTNGGQQMVNVDHFSDPAFLQIRCTITSETDWCPGTAYNTITNGLSKWTVRDTDESTYKDWALTENGYLWKRAEPAEESSQGLWYLHANVGGHGNGLGIYNGKRYYCTDASLIDEDGVSRAIDSDTLWHPLKEYLGCLFGGAGRYIFKLESDGTFTARALTLKEGVKIKSLEVYGDKLVIGTWAGTILNEKSEAYLFTWDGVSEFPIQSLYLQENGINGMALFENILIIFAGIKGNVYLFDGVNLKKELTLNVMKAISVGDGTDDWYPFVIPGGVCQWGDKILVGVSVENGGSDATTGRFPGIYVFGRTTAQSPISYDIILPENNYTQLYFGSVMPTGFNKYLAAYKEGAVTRILCSIPNNFNIDAVFKTQKYEIMKSGKRGFIKGVRFIFDPLIFEDGITYTTYFDDVELVGGQIMSENQNEIQHIGQRGDFFQLYIEFNGSGDYLTTPKLKKIEIY
jgi:hypothetical protein